MAFSAEWENESLIISALGSCKECFSLCASWEIKRITWFPCSFFFFFLLKYFSGYTNMKIFQQLKAMELLSIRFLFHYSKETMGTQHLILFDRNLVSRSHVVCLFCSIVVSPVLCNLSQGFWEWKMSQSKYTKLILSLLHCKGQVVNSEAEHWQQESLGTQYFYLMKLRISSAIWSC